MENFTKSIEQGYVIKVTGIQRDGTLYKEGYLGDDFYDSLVNAYVCPEEEIKDKMDCLATSYNDGTVIFKAYKITREINIEIREAML